MSTQPRQLSEEDKQTWLEFYGDLPEVARYLSTGQPPYGIHVPIKITNEITEDFVLFIPTLDGVADPANLRIVLMDNTDPTQGSFLVQLDKAPFQSPDDDGFWNNFMRQFEKTIPQVGEGVSSLLKWAVVGIVALGVLQLAKK